MANLEVIYDKVHLRHDPRWCACDKEAGWTVCVACVVELMDTDHVSTVRKCAVLSGVTQLLRKAGAMRDMLLQDERVCLHFLSSLLRALPISHDSAMQEKVVQVLVQVLLDVKNEQCVQHTLDQLHTQLCDGGCGRSSLPSVTVLGKLLDTLPALADMLTSTHLCVLECVYSCLLNPDEDLKAAVCYVFRSVWTSQARVQSLPHTLREKVCVLLLHTLTHASSLTLTVNGLGLLLSVLRDEEAVCLMMNQTPPPEEDEDEEEESQCTQLSTKHCSLPLILKRLVLSGDEVVQVVSVKCVCAVLGHSPTQYSAPFIHADLPEFLFECVSSSSSDVLLWSVYSCLSLLCEDSLFYSNFHSVYGIESLVRSLKAVLKSSNVEVQKQGLDLLTAVLQRQPPGVRLFPAPAGFVGVADVVVLGVANSSLQVALHAARAAAALLRTHHQSIPVHYGELKRVIKAVTSRCAELPLHTTTTQRRRCFTGPETRGQFSRAGAFLIQALKCVQEACRLAEECVCDSSVKEESSSTADQQDEDTLESLCVCLLQCCDTHYIPTVTRVWECGPSPQVLELFLSIVSLQFSLSPSLMPTFAAKLASSGFIRLTLDNKVLLCSGNRNAALNSACCSFLTKLCTSLLSQRHPEPGPHHHACVEQVECVLRECLPSLRFPVCDWPSVLSEDLTASPNTHYCLLHLLYLSMLHGDRLLCDKAVFSSVVQFVCVMQHQCDVLPPSVLQSVIYLLAETQDSSPDLEQVVLICIIKAVSSCPLSSSPLSVPYPSLLRFTFRYPELSERFGVTVLESWLMVGSDPGQCGEEGPDAGDSSGRSVLLEVLVKNPASVLTLLAVVCKVECVVARRALGVLRSHLQTGKGSNSSHSSMLKPALLQLLQRLTCDSADVNTPSTTVPDCVCVVLEVLCVVQSECSTHTDMENTDFKLLYHVSSLVGKLTCNNTEYLLPALNYIYCCLTTSPSHTAERALSMLLHNSTLMEILETLLKTFSSSSSSSSSSPPSSALLSCSILLLSSLITLQHTHSTQVNKSVCVDLNSVVNTLTFYKRHTDNLVLVCVVRLVQVLLDVDLCSALVCVECESVERQRPLLPADGALHPLTYTVAVTLHTALQNTLMQKQELLLSASGNCVTSLIRFLYRRRPSIAQHVVCQPWNRFLLYSLLNSGESLSLHPATLSLLATLVGCSAGVAQWQLEVESVCEAAEKRGMEMDVDSKHTLQTLLTACSELCVCEKLKLRVDGLLESLRNLPPPETRTSSMLRVGSLYICSSDFRVKLHSEMSEM